jgi:hypothetical protein
MNNVDLDRKLYGELGRLLREQIESLEKETFMGLSQEEKRQEEARFTRIREFSAGYLAAMKQKGR